MENVQEVENSEKTIDAQVAHVVQKIALDIGKADVKIKFDNQEFKFPTAIERIKEGSVNYSDTDDEDVYEYNGKKYLVGARALNNSISTRGFNFMAKNSSLLAYHAIKLAGLNVEKPIEIATTLSIEDWSHKEEFLKALKNIQVDKNIIQPNIALYAQGQGAFIEYDGDKSGIICVFDMGYYTNDLLIFEDGRPRNDLSYATKKGSNQMITELQTKLKNRFLYDVTEQVAKKAFLNKFIMHYNEKIPLCEEVEDLIEEYLEFTFDELKAKSVDVLRQANAVIISGGVANYIDTAEMPNNVILSKKPYEFANVRGTYQGAFNG